MAFVVVGRISDALGGCEVRLTWGADKEDKARLVGKPETSVVLNVDNAAVKMENAAAAFPSAGFAPVV